MAGKPTPQISQAIQSRIRPNGWVRVLVELKLPNRAVPEASLKNLTAVLAQRQIIGSRREKLLAKLPPGTYRVLRAYLTIPYVAMDVTTSSVAILADSASDVEAVLPDALARPDLADSGPLVQADQAWSAGYDGVECRRHRRHRRRCNASVSGWQGRRRGVLFEHRRRRE
jgi:hypothetical protein